LKYRFEGSTKAMGIRRFHDELGLEVADSSWWKQQLRVKIAGRRITALCANYIRLMQHEERAAQA
jgi:hypothetical protein